MQAQLMSVLALAGGNSVITERIFPDRFLHVGELNRMGARIRKEGPTAIIQGVKELQGASIMASDLRASAALVLAGLVAKGIGPVTVNCGVPTAYLPHGDAAGILSRLGLDGPGIARVVLEHL